MSTNYHASALNIPIMQSDYSFKEELANALSHGLGIILGVIGLILMIQKADGQVDLLQMFGVIVYGCSIIILFTCSTLYHSIQLPLWRSRLKMADHCAIYLLIAGTYTPLMLITLNTFSAYVILCSIWLLAVGGIIFKVYFLHKFEKVSVAIYLLMGWLCLIVISDLIAKLSELGFNLLLIGGVFYSVGVIFYVAKRIPYNHAIWHMFVLMGALSHFLCVYLTVI